MKKMLFVDDRSKRLHFALDHYGKEYDVTLCCNVPEALRLLATREWDVVSLDHDLNGHDFQDPEFTGSGMEIVRYIQKCGGWPKQEQPGSFPPIFWIHSSNIFAAHLMITTLIEIDLHAYWKPIRANIEYIQYDEKGIPK